MCCVNIWKKNNRLKTAHLPCLSGRQVLHDLKIRVSIIFNIFLELLPFKYFSVVILKIPEFCFLNKHYLIFILDYDLSYLFILGSTTYCWTPACTVARGNTYKIGDSGQIHLRKIHSISFKINIDNERHNFQKLPLYYMSQKGKIWFFSSHRLGKCCSGEIKYWICFIFTTVHPFFTKLCHIKA